MELADVPASKSGGSDTVSVRPRSPAPNALNRARFFLSKLTKILKYDKINV